MRYIQDGGGAQLTYLHNTATSAPLPSVRHVGTPGWGGGGRVLRHAHCWALVVSHIQKA